MALQILTAVLDDICVIAQTVEEFAFRADPIRAAVPMFYTVKYAVVMCNGARLISRWSGGRASTSSRSASV